MIGHTISYTFISWLPLVDSGYQHAMPHLDALMQKVVMIKMSIKANFKKKNKQTLKVLTGLTLSKGPCPHHKAELNSTGHTQVHFNIWIVL